MGRITLRAARGLALASAAAAALAVGLSASTAAAGGYEELQRCAQLTGLNEATTGVEVCTAAIDSGELTQPNTAIAYYNRGNAYRRLDRLAEAEADFTKAIDLWPELDHAWNNRGGVRARLCRADEALADFKEAMALDPEWVKRYQEALQRAGVDVGVIDGKYGPKTESALLELIRGQCET